MQNLIHAINIGIIILIAPTLWWLIGFYFPSLTKDSKKPEEGKSPE